MLYGWLLERVVTVGAADTLDELLRFHETRFETDTDEVTALVEHKVGRLFGNFPIVLRKFGFKSQDDAKSFAHSHDVNICETPQIVRKQIEIAASSADGVEGIVRPLTVKETLGLSEDDVPSTGQDKSIGGDRRQNAIDDAHEADIRLAEREVRETGSIKTGDYVVFSVGQTDDEKNTVAHFVVKRRIGDDNSNAAICQPERLRNLPDDMVLVSPGYYACRDLDVAAARTLISDLGYFHDPSVHEVFTKPRAARGREIDPARGDEFYRFDIENVTIEALDGIFTNEDHTYAKTSAGYGEVGNAVWYAFRQETLANRFSNRVARHGLACSAIIRIDASNNPKTGAAPRPKSPPRPWSGPDDVSDGTPNDPSRYASKEFYYARCRVLVAGQLRVALVPIVFFKRTNAIFDQPLNLGDRLPMSLKEDSPGIFTTKSADWDTLKHELERVGFRADLRFQSYVNQL